MKKILLLLLALTVFSFAEEDKHPWYLDIKGNKAFSNYQLEEQLDIPEEFGKMDTTKQDFMMRLSLENIKALYYSRGYYSLSLTMDIQRNYVAQDSCIRGYYITIRDGERYRFNGAKLIVPEDRKVEIDVSKLNIAQDHLYNQEDIAEDMEDIQKAYRREGYLHTTLSSIERIDTTQKKIYVEITIEPGAKVIMGNMVSYSHRTKDKRNHNIAVTETGLTDTAWLSSLWRIPEGEIIDGNQYNTFRNKLFSTQLFTQIKMSDSLREDGLSDVYLNVTERVPGEMRYGFFFEEIYGFGAQASARHKNFFGRLHEFSTSAQIAQHKQEASIGYANPLLFGTSFSFIPTAIRFEDRFTLNHEKINPPAYPDSLEERYEIINRGDLTFGITNNIRRPLQIGGVLVFLFMLVYYNRLSRALFTALPSVFAACWFIAALNFFDVKISAYSALIFPILIGASVDGSLQFFTAYYEKQKGTALTILRDKFFTIFLSQMAAFIGTYGMLISSHPGLRSMG